MAPQAKVQCFAAKDKKGKLERCEYEPLPLQAGDIGTMDLHVDDRISACILVMRSACSRFWKAVLTLFWRLQRLESPITVCVTPMFT